MTSKILDAVQQLEQGIESLEQGKIAVDKTIREKRLQIRELLNQYLLAQPEVEVEDVVLPPNAATRNKFPYANFGVVEGEFQSVSKESADKSLVTSRVWNMLDSLREQAHDLERYANTSVGDKLTAVKTQVDNIIAAFEEDY